MKFGQKVKAFPNIEDARVGFIVEPTANEDGEYGVQVGADVFALKHAEEPGLHGARGGTFETL